MGRERGGKLCVEFCVTGLARIYQRLHVAHAGAGGGGKTIEQHKNDGALPVTLASWAWTKIKARRLRRS